MQPTSAGTSDLHERQRLQRPGAWRLHAPGTEGFIPANGNLTDPGHSAGYYSRARGLGADDMLLTSAGLWIASDNLDGNTSCGGQSGYAGIWLAV